MQAEAAGIAPTVDMNPILLKPTSQMGSQVIVNGEVFGNLRAMDYYRRKTEFIPAVREAFERLESQFDAIVLKEQEVRQRLTCGTMISSIWVWQRLRMRRCFW